MELGELQNHILKQIELITEKCGDLSKVEVSQLYERVMVDDIVTYVDKGAVLIRAVHENGKATHYYVMPPESVQPALFHTLERKVAA